MSDPPGNVDAGVHAIQVDGAAAVDAARVEPDAETFREGGASTDSASPAIDAGTPDAWADGLPPIGVDPDLAPPAAACTGPQASGRAVVCVDATATGAETGAAAAPFHSIGGAVAAAKAGDVVQVAGGTYAESVLVDKAVDVVGGFAGKGDFARRDRRRFVSTVQVPASAPAEQGAGFFLRDAGDARILGFRVTGGKGVEESGKTLGGGIYVTVTSRASATQQPVIANCLVENNAVAGRVGDPSEWRGGGIAVGAVNAQILGNVVLDNRAGRGAGIAVLGSPNALVKENVIRKNVAVGDHGGGAYLLAPLVTFTGNVVEENEIGRALGYGWGGAVYVSELGNRAELSYNILTGNFAPSLGAGEFIDNGATALIDHELFYANACPSNGAAAIYADSLDGSGNNGSVVEVKHTTIVDHGCSSAILVEGAGSRISIDSSILWNNGPVDVVAISGGSYTAGYTLSSQALDGPGNLSSDPFFVDVAAHNYHLQSRGGHYDATTGTWPNDTRTSPAIDAANPAAPFSAEPIPNGGRANLGCYGNTPVASRSGS